MYWIYLWLAFVFINLAVPGSVRYSENNIMRFNTQVEPTIDPNSICKDYLDLGPHQQSLCRRYPHATASAIQGLVLAIHECRKQFAGDRWNCSNLDETISYKHPMVHKGFKETSFIHAISAAGILHQVATACAMGKINSCGCENNYIDGPTEEGFQWNGCSHDLGFGAKYSRRFLQKKDKDIHSLMQAHNSKLGRKAVIDQKGTKCKCHGMSSSCEVKTCWLAAPDFHMVGDRLKILYERSVKVDRTNSVKGKIIPHKIEGSKRIDSKKLKKHLVYYENSPTYCSSSNELGSQGTSGRQCNSTSSGPDSCNSLCCGRGYFTIRMRRIEKCNCKFHWCCYVVCKKCEYDEWVTVCK